MSSPVAVHGSGVVTALTLLLVLIPGEYVRAQTSQADQAALVQRLDSLTPLYRRASEEAMRFGEGIRP